MSDYIETVPAVEVGEGSMVKVDVDGHPLLIANAGGAFYAADAFCPHLHGHLWEGDSGRNGHHVPQAWIAVRSE